MVDHPYMTVTEYRGAMLCFCARGGGPAMRSTAAAKPCRRIFLSPNFFFVVISMKDLIVRCSIFGRLLMCLCLKSKVICCI